MRRPKPSISMSGFVLLATVFVVIAALYFAQEVLVPLALAILFCFLLAPLVRRLERRIGRVASVTIVVLVAFGLLAGLGYVVGKQMVELANNLDQYKDNILAKVVAVRPSGPNILQKLADTAEDVRTQFETPATQETTRPATTQAATQLTTGPATQELTQESPEAGSVASALDAPVAGAKTTLRRLGSGMTLDQPSPVTTTRPSVNDPLPVRVIPTPSSPFETLSTYLGVIAGPLGTFGIVLVFVVFMLLQREDLRDRLIRLVGFGELNIATRAMDDASARISRFLTAQAIVNGSYGATIAVGLWLIGFIFGGNEPAFPNVPLWGLLCALLRFIPYIGPWIAAAMPLAISLAVYKGFGVFVATGVLFVVIELLSNNVMEPMLYGSSTGMSTLAVLVSAVFWTWLWGPVGLLMATPLTVCLVVLGKYVPQLAFLEVLLGDKPVLAPAERVYQRLLAKDQEEVANLLDDYLDKSTLDEVFDTVVLPALAMAEQDSHRDNLDDERREFIRTSMREIIDELSDREKRKVRKQQADAVVDMAMNDAGSAPVSKAREVGRLPDGCAVNVVILPAHDPADEIAGLMLAQLLEVRNFCVFNVSETALASEMLEAVENRAAHIVVISALPPAAITHARYLLKRLRQRFTDAKTVVGLWTVSSDLKRARDRIDPSETTILTSSLRDAVYRIEQASQAIVFAAPQAK